MPLLPRGRFSRPRSRSPRRPPPLAEDLDSADEETLRLGALAVASPSRGARVLASPPQGAEGSDRAGGAGGAEDLLSSDGSSGVCLTSSPRSLAESSCCGSGDDDASLLSAAGSPAPSEESILAGGVGPEAGQPRGDRGWRPGETCGSWIDQDNPPDEQARVLVANAVEVGASIPRGLRRALRAFWSLERPSTLSPEAGPFFLNK